MTLNGKTLLIDADDTLWENNIYFQEAMAHFLNLMEGLGFAPADMRRALNDLERENIKLRGYGSKKLIISMKETFLMHCREGNYNCSSEMIDSIKWREADPSMTVLANPPDGVCATHCGEDGTRCLVQRIEQLGSNITRRPLILLPDVEETLRQLANRYRLLLFTKGDPSEQMDKVERSRLAAYFYAVEIAREKNREAYLELIEKYHLVTASAWMIGNSPRSDINPATLAGLRAVFIPHPCTWELEEEEILQPDRVTVLRSFRELLDMF